MEESTAIVSVMPNTIGGRGSAALQAYCSTRRLQRSIGITPKLLILTATDCLFCPSKNRLAAHISCALLTLTSGSTWVIFLCCNKRFCSRSTLLQGDTSGECFTI